MKLADEKRSPERVELSGILSEFRDALEEEIDKIKKSGQSSTLLYDGRIVKSHGEERWYQFQVEYAPVIPADTPCKLLVGKEQYDVAVVAFEESAIIVSSKTHLPDTLGKARLENGATVLMERLIKCIEENARVENAAGKRMLPPESGVYSAQRIFTYDDIALRESNTESQNEAVVSALSYDITYIWGPPGTGKTTVIGQIISELYKHERSALVLSHTNTAVDGAIEKADNAYSASNPESNEIYPILRIGNPKKELPKRVLLEEHVNELGKALYEQKQLLEKQKSELSRRISEIQLLLAKADWQNENQLEQIESILKRISGYENNIRVLQSEIERIDAAIRREKAAHPEYAKLAALSKAVNAKKADYDRLCEEISKTETAIHEIPLSIQHVQDEIRKHSVYAELRAREAKYMSASFIQNELAKIDGQITDFNSDIVTLTANRAAAQQILADYEKKSGS